MLSEISIFQNFRRSNDVPSLSRQDYHHALLASNNNVYLTSGKKTKEAPAANILSPQNLHHQIAQEWYGGSAPCNRPILFQANRHHFRPLPLGSQGILLEHSNRTQHRCFLIVEFVRLTQARIYCSMTCQNMILFCAAVP